MPHQREIVAIADLYVLCSLQVSNLHTGYSAMSDCCQRFAAYGVVMDAGAIMWRCDEHKNIRYIDEQGRFAPGAHVTEISRI